MLRFNKAQLIHTLKECVALSIQETNQILTLEHQILTAAPLAGSWSISQIIEHLNTYNNYYLPLINQSFRKASPLKSQQVIYHPSWLGNYFVKLMEPQNNEVKKKMKAASKHIPEPVADPVLVLKTFIEGQKELSALLDSSLKYDIEKLNTPISIIPIVRLRVGDVFRFLAAHQQRHFVQIRANKVKLAENR